MADQSPHWSARGLTAGHYELDLTRTCLSQGRVLVTYRLMQALPAGELTLRDANADQPVTLTFLPPRTLTGLGPYFERHNLRPNDRLILVLSEEGGFIDMQRRPPPVRPSRPEPTAEPAPAERPKTVERIAAYGGSLPEERALPAQKTVTDEETRIGRVRALHRPPAEAAAPEAAAPRPSAPAAAPRPARKPAGAPATDRAPDSQAAGPAPQSAPPPPPPPQVAPQNVAEAVRLRLEEPGVPAIVRASKLAQSLHCDARLVEDALDTLSRDPDSGVDKINSGVYRHAVLTRSQ